MFSDSSSSHPRRVASLVVSRGLGRTGDAAAAWEIFSDKIGGQIPAVEDLLLTGELKGSASLDPASSRSPKVRVEHFSHRETRPTALVACSQDLKTH